MIILIDNGHGQNTPGKCSPDHTYYEWAYTREIARLLQAELTARGLDARLLVPETTDISLTERARRANQLCAIHGTANVILISLHTNAAGNGQWMKARGWSAYTSPGNTKADRLAENLYTQAINHLPPGTLIRTDLTDGDRDYEARFTILTATRCPAVLTENLFHDNRDDLAYLKSPAGKRAITLLHADAITDYIRSR